MHLDLHLLLVDDAALGERLGRVRVRVRARVRVRVRVRVRLRVRVRVSRRGRPG